MPYKSLAQMRYLHSQKPEVAKKWDKKYDTPEDLPKKLAKLKMRKEK